MVLRSKLRIAFMDFGEIARRNWMDCFVVSPEGHRWKGVAWMGRSIGVLGSATCLTRFKPHPGRLY